MGSNTLNKPTIFFKDKPVFGFDIGHSSLKVMQIDGTSKRPKLIGYGTADFEVNAIKDGVIVNHEAIAKSALDLFKNHLIGDITTNRAVIGIPAYRTFARSISLPKLSQKELLEAINLDAEQYIPVPLDKLYLDYSIIERTVDTTELFVIAVPKDIVDSQLELMRIMNIEVIGVETTIGSAGRLFQLDHQSDVPTVLIDFGSSSADITIFDQTLVVTGTVPGGGLIFTDQIEKKLGVTHEEAGIIKTKYGLSPSKRQQEIISALEPVLNQVATELRRMIRYYEDRTNGKRKIGQVVTLGGGANMPGLSGYLTNKLRLAVRACDPWEYCDVHGLQGPNAADKPMYATAMGLSLVTTKEIFS
jgi:type IV pilus assembly protein PilM